jgi:hypothetical protein
MIANKTQCRSTDRYPYSTIYTDNFGERFYITSKTEEQHNRAMARVDHELLGCDKFKDLKPSIRAFLGVESYIR